MASFGMAGGATAGATAGSVVPGVGTAVGTAVGAAVGAFTSLFGGDQKEAQRESYLNGQAAQAQAGNIGALKLIYDWANGISATEWDGTNRGNEPNASKQYAQQILLNLQKNGIVYNASTGSILMPGLNASAQGAVQIANVFGFGANPVGFFVIVGMLGVVTWLGLEAIKK